MVRVVRSGFDAIVSLYFVMSRGGHVIEVMVLFLFFVCVFLLFLVLMFGLVIVLRKLMLL